MNNIENLVLHVQAALNGEPYIKKSTRKKTVRREEIVDVNAESMVSDPVAKTDFLTKKELVIKAIHDRSRGEVGLEDLPSVEKELIDYFDEYKNNDYFNDLDSNDYYRLLDLRKEPDTRVVVIGDIHCDYKSLAAILFKLSVSEYDYFEKAYFVFLGDYLDRGSTLLEPLLLLMDLQRILDRRMIMLRGNHELIRYNELTQQLESSVIPQESAPTLNEYCGTNKEFLSKFGFFYKTLPTYVYLKAGDDNILLTHGSIPRQDFVNSFRFNQDDGSIVFESEFLLHENLEIEKMVFDDSLRTKTTKLNADLLLHRNQILYDMIWGDPKENDINYRQSRGRFNFGKPQFEEYANKNRISRLFRSHEPVDFGFKAFFDNRLFTIFSTGGSQNEQSGYPYYDPAFAVIKGTGDFLIENSYVYKLSICGVVEAICNFYTCKLINGHMAKSFSLNDEFLSSIDKAIEIGTLYVDLINGFLPQTIEETAPGPEQEKEPEPELKCEKNPGAKKTEKKRKQKENKTDKETDGNTPQD